MPRPPFGTAVNYWLPILGRQGIDELRWLWREDLALGYRRRDFPWSVGNAGVTQASSAPFPLHFRAPSGGLGGKQAEAAYEVVSPAGQPLVFYYLFTKGSLSYVALAGDEWVADDSVDVHHAAWGIWYTRPEAEYESIEVPDGPLQWWWRRLLQNRHPSDLDFLYSYVRLVAHFPSHRWPQPAPAR